MAHTTRIGNTSFIDDGDGMGDVEIVHGKQRITVPAKALKGIVAEWMRGAHIEILEHRPRREILHLGFPGK